MLAQYRTPILLFALVASAFFSASSQAKQDVPSVIKSGLSAYEKGELGTAAQQITYALQLINNKYGELLAKQMPSALKGWQAGKPKHQTSPMLLGGGVTVKRIYMKGKSKVDIQIVKDSPLLQSLMMVMNNPMMMGMDGGRMQQIKGYNAIVKFSEKSRRGELSVIVENRFLILIKSVKTSEDDLLAYAEAFNFDGIKKLLK